MRQHWQRLLGAADSTGMSWHWLRYAQVTLLDAVGRHWVQCKHFSGRHSPNKEAVQQLERNRRDCEKIHGRDRFPMITKKGRQRWASFRSLGARFI